MYNSQYYTCEQIDQRLLQGYLDDYNSQNNTNLTKEQFLTLLFNTIGRNSTVYNLVTQIGYYECDTAAGTAAKVITVANYALFAGGSMKVKFANKNTANNATLNINSQGAKALYYQGERASATNSWDDNEVVEIYYDGTSYYANNVKGGSGSGVYDVSKEHPTSGPNGDGKFTIEYILNSSNVNELIPVNKRYPGMSIQFVSTYDNKYVQYRLMSDTFNTTTANWQGVDDKPIAGSDNLVKSGGVASIYGSITSQTKEVITLQTYTDSFENIKIKQGQKFRLKATGDDGIFGGNRVDVYAEAQSNPKLAEFFINGDAIELIATSDITTLIFYRYKSYVLGSGSVTIEVFVEGNVTNEHLIGIKERINDVDERATYNSHKLIDSNGVYMSDKGLYTIKDFEIVTLSNVTMACSRYVKTNGKNVTFYIKQNTGNYRIIVYQFNAYGTALGYYNPALFVKDKIVYSGNAEYVKLVVAKNTGSYVNLTSDDLANFTILCDNPEYNAKTDIAFTSIIDKSSYKIAQLAGKDILKFADDYFIVINDAELSARILYDVVQNVATSNERYVFQPYGYNDTLEEVEALTSGYVDHCDISDIQYKYVSFYVAKQIKSGNNWALTDITLADVEKFKIQVKKNFCDFANYIQIKKNLKVDILGDSITEQGYYTSALAALGYTINNYGASGTTISDARSNNFIGRVSSMSLDCDAVIIFGGVNDWVLGAPLGTFMTQNSDSEFYSALNDLIVAVKERFIGKPIYICTPLHSQFTLQGYDSKLEFSNDGNSIIKNKYGNGAYLVDYVNAIKEVAEMYSVEVIDLYNESGISPFIASYKTMYTQDGLHPNAAGGVLVAKCIDKYIKVLKE